MSPIVMKSRVGHDGILHLEVPIGLQDADREVQITVRPADVRHFTQEEWRQAVLETAGKWQGDFQRAEQGDWPEREALM